MESLPLFYEGDEVLVSRKWEQDRVWLRARIVSVRVADDGLGPFVYEVRFSGDTRSGGLWEAEEIRHVTN